MSFNPITDKVPEPDLLAVQGTEEQLADLEREERAARLEAEIRRRRAAQEGGAN